MYSASLAQASAQGIILGILIVAVAFGVYFLFSHRAEFLGAVVWLLIAGFITKDYYHLVYAAGAMFFIAGAMYLTHFDEGTFRDSLFWGAVGIFVAMILYYLNPAVLETGTGYEGMNKAFVIALILATFFVIIEGFRSGFQYDSEAAIAIIAAFAVAFFLVKVIGITHLAWGVGFMVFGVIMETLTRGLIAVTTFAAGVIIWLDDVIGYRMYSQNEHALSIFLPIGVILIVIFAYLQWRD